MLVTQLAAKGYSVSQANNGKEGHKKALVENPDLILLDIRMPEMDGMAMLDLLRKGESNKKTKVIILTNFEPDDKIIENVVKNQPDYYFVKSDISLNELFGEIQKLIGV